jgi:hypothetical protein
MNNQQVILAVIFLVLFGLYSFAKVLRRVKALILIPVFMILALLMASKNASIDLNAPWMLPIKAVITKTNMIDWISGGKYFKNMFGSDSSKAEGN